MKSIILFIIKIGKILFYNTPFHRSKLVNVIYEKLFHSVYKKDEILEVPYLGCIFKIPARDMTILPSLINNDYERYVLDLYKQILKPGMTVVDIGANIGIFSILGAKVVGTTGTIICFEPEPGNFELLKENILINNVVNVRPENLAVGAEKAVLKLQIERNSIGTHSILNRADKGIEREVSVNVVSIDDYVKRLKHPIDVMKIDVEGYEPYVLMGGRCVIEKVQYLFFEYIKSDIEASIRIDDFLDLLSSFPFIYGIDEKRHSIRRFTLDDFQHVKYINILASKTEVSL